MTTITRRAGLTAVGAGLLAASGCGSSFSSSSTSASSGAPPAAAPQKTAGPQQLSILFGSSGTAETKNLQDLCSTWATQNSAKVTVIAASNLPQQLAQGFAANKPADVFYVDPTLFQGYVKAGNLHAYGAQLPFASDFYPNLVSAYTLNGTFYAAPKDISTLGLQINTALWKAAGLTTADYPTSWAQLTAVAKKLTTSKVVGLSLGTSRDRVGAFLRQAGGWYLNADQTKATANSAANLKALTYVKTMLTTGVMKWASDIGATWGGEAFGTGKAAMTIEGNWVAAAMASDYPTVKYVTATLPKGPAGPGTLSFTNAWGIAAKSQYLSAAFKLVEFLCSATSQLAISSQVGTIPSRKSVAPSYAAKFPAQRPFVAEAPYAHAPVTLSSMVSVLADFDTQLASLAKQEPAAILARLQKNTAAAIAT